MPETLTLRSHLPSAHNKDPRREMTFDEVVERIGVLRREGRLRELRLEIPVNKYNFVDLQPVVNRALGFLGLPQLAEDPLPGAGEEGGLPGFFQRQVHELNEKLQGMVVVRHEDELARALLERIQARYGSQALEVFSRLRDLSRIQRSDGDHLRVLGAMLEDTFVGPAVMVLDLYHRCNTDCLHCWIHGPTARSTHSPEFLNLKLDLPLIKRIVDDACELGISNFTLLGDGEPMLHPDFCDIVHYIKAKDIYNQVVVFTNGLTLTERISRLLVEMRVDQLYCSIPAATARTWARINPSHPEAHFQIVKENLLRLRELKQARGKGPTSPRPQPKVIMTYVLHNLNFFEVEQMALLAAEVGAEQMHFQIIQVVKTLEYLALDRGMIRFMQQRIPRLEQIAREHEMHLVPGFRFQLEHILSGPDEIPQMVPLKRGCVLIEDVSWSRSVFTRQGCFIGWAFTLIKANADVSFCCALKVVDNLKERSFKEVWLSERYLRYRVAAKDLLKNRRVEFQRSIYDIDHHLYNERCEQCNNHEPNTYYLDLIDRAGLRPFIPGLP